MFFTSIAQIEHNSWTYETACIKYNSSASDSLEIRQPALDLQEGNFFKQILKF